MIHSEYMHTPMISIFKFLLAGHKVGGEGPRVVVDGVSKVVGKVLEWALTGDDSLHKEAEHGEHGEAAILELLHLKLGECLGVVSQTKRVEAATRVEWVDDLS